MPRSGRPAACGWSGCARIARVQTSHAVALVVALVVVGLAAGLRYAFDLVEDAAARVGR